MRIYNRIPEAFRTRVVIGLTGEYNQCDSVFIRSGQVRIYNRIPEAFRLRVVIGLTGEYNQCDSVFMRSGK